MKNRKVKFLVGIFGVFMVFAFVEYLLIKDKELENALRAKYSILHKYKISVVGNKGENKPLCLDWPMIQEFDAKVRSNESMTVIASYPRDGKGFLYLECNVADLSSSGWDIVGCTGPLAEIRKYDKAAYYDSSEMFELGVADAKRKRVSVINTIQQKPGVCGEKEKAQLVPPPTPLQQELPKHAQVRFERGIPLDERGALQNLADAINFGTKEGVISLTNGGISSQFGFEGYGNLSSRGSVNINVDRVRLSDGREISIPPHLYVVTISDVGSFQCRLNKINNHWQITDCFWHEHEPEDEP